MPKASIIIPCYNAASYISDTLVSARNQTVTDIEIICVDDGSTDDTLSILQAQAAEDPRIRVFHQRNAGEGPAREAGRRQATGDWLAFLDADDFFEPTAVEEAVACGEREHADVVIFRTRLFNNVTGELSECDWAFRHNWIDGMVFSPGDNPSRLLNSFQNWACVKMFRRSFVDKQGLFFQSVHRTADLLFTCRALTEANRIALLDRPLYRYRVNNATSAIRTSDSYPLDFYSAFLALRKALEQHGTWELYHDSFVAWAAEGIAVNLQLTRSFSGFCTIADEIRNRGLRLLDITTPVDRPQTEAPLGERVCWAIANLSNAELAYELFSIEKEHSASSDNHSSQLRLDCNTRNAVIVELDERNRVLEERASALWNSMSFKIGRGITAPIRAVVAAVRKENDHD